MATYKTQAIIINRLNLGESDRILTLFSADHGKFRAIAKGSRKTKSKFGGHTELFSLGEFIIATGKNLDIVNEVSLVNNYFSENPDMEKVKTAYYFAEIINRLLPDHAKNQEVYALFIYCLEQLKNVDEKLVQLIFVAKLLKTLGIYPELNNCIKCGNKPDPKSLYFTKTGGGILDKTCSRDFEDSTEVKEATIKLWRYVADAPTVTIKKINTASETILEANNLANSYIHFATSIDYRSLRVLS